MNWCYHAIILSYILLQLETFEEELYVVPETTSAILLKFDYRDAVTNWLEGTSFPRDYCVVQFSVDPDVIESGRPTDFIYGDWYVITDLET